MSKLLPYETILKAHEGDPDAIDTVLSHYAGYIRYCSKVHGKVNTEVEEYVKQNSAVLPLAGNLLGSAFPKPCYAACAVKKISVRRKVFLSFAPETANR